MSAERKNVVRIVALALAFVFCILASATATILISQDIYTKKIKATEREWHKIRVADSALYSDDGYIDYANEVFLDVENYPDMREMGLFWAEWDNTQSKAVLKDADSEEGAALIDPAKPTIIMVHGMLTDGYYHQEPFYLGSKSGNPSEFGLTTDSVSMINLWILEGWNVGVYHYNRFGSEAGPAPIEAKIWGIDGEKGMRIQHEDASYSDNVTEYSLAEHFVAEYLRAMNLLPETMGDREIRVAAHSMGGELMSASIFLLTEVSSAGQLEYKKLPDRYALLDPYFSTNIDMGDKMMYMGPKDMTIRWSGKQIVNNNTGYTTIECLKDLAANGIALEYYTNKESFLKASMPEDITEDLKAISVYVIVNPDWKYYGRGYSIISNGHNGVRDWYLCSIKGDMVKNGDPQAVITVAASAKTPTSIILAQRGMAFTLAEGSRTVHPNDDIFVPLT
ncbi:MAG TPA: hypothetical protein PKY53_06045 [Clostridia bacterium]|nr:hypothetical protein [Clostridia bacterium]